MRCRGVGRLVEMAYRTVTQIHNNNLSAYLTLVMTPWEIAPTHLSSGAIAKDRFTLLTRFEGCPREPQVIDMHKKMMVSFESMWDSETEIVKEDVHGFWSSFRKPR